MITSTLSILANDSDTFFALRLRKYVLALHTVSRYQNEEVLERETILRSMSQHQLTAARRVPERMVKGLASVHMKTGCSDGVLHVLRNRVSTMSIAT